MNILEKLFGSQARVRLMRIFYLNPSGVLAKKEAASMARVSSRSASKEIKLLLSLGFLEKSKRFDEIKKSLPAGRQGKKPKNKKVEGFLVSETFPLFSALRNLIVTASPASRENILHFFKKYRKIKLVCIGGVFMDSSLPGALTDLLIVGNGIKKNILEKFIKKLEPDVGKEINWTILSFAEFNDRVAMHDKFLRDFFDLPNECLINKIETA
ncbi:MAG: hypothetical protein AAB522_00465 [Patescibacteria group bacterium]